MLPRCLRDTPWTVAAVMQPMRPCIPCLRVRAPPPLLRQTVFQPDRPLPPLHTQTPMTRGWCRAGGAVGTTGRHHTQ